MKKSAFIFLIFVILIVTIFLYIKLSKDKSILNSIVDKINNKEVISIDISKYSKVTGEKIETKITGSESINNALEKLSQIKTVSTNKVDIDTNVKTIYEIAILDEYSIALGINFYDSKNIDVIELNSKSNQIHHYVIENKSDVFKLLDSFFI